MTKILSKNTPSSMGWTMVNEMNDMDYGRWSEWDGLLTEGNEHKQ